MKRQEESMKETKKRQEETMSAVLELRARQGQAADTRAVPLSSSRRSFRTASRTSRLATSDRCCVAAVVLAVLPVLCG
jgi:hypothetical protein